jgi:cobalt-zinc-cadmium resistance protein CzcA
MQVKAVALKYKTGESSQLEQIMSITRKEEFQQMIRQNQTAKDMERKNLAMILQLKEDITFELVDYGVLDLFDVSDAASLTQNTAVSIALQDVKLADMQVNLEKAQMKPEFSVGYFIQSLTGNQEVNNQIISYNGVPRFQGPRLVCRYPSCLWGVTKLRSAL